MVEVISAELERARQNEARTNLAMSIMSQLVLEDGRTWAEAAEPDQVQDAYDVLDLNKKEPYYLFTRARGRSKTSDLAGMVLAVMLSQSVPGAKLYGIAADKDQARLLIDAARGYQARDNSLDLKKHLRFGNYVIAIPKLSISYEVIAADAASAYGLKPSFLVVDELAQWKSTPGVQELWTAVTSAMVKVPDARMVVITSAGDPAHWSHVVRKNALESQSWHVHELHGPAPWQSEILLEEQRKRLAPSVFARLFLNEWTASEDRIASYDDIMACVGKDRIQILPPSPDYTYVIGVDLGIKNDRTAVAIVHQEIHGDTPHVIVDEMHTWKGSKESPLNLQTVEDWLNEKAKEYNYAKLVFDPSQAIGMMQRLANEYQIEEYNFSGASVAKLALSLLIMFKDHRLNLPDKHELIEELSNVRLRSVSPGVYRMDHDPSRHDDQAIALALAVQDCLKSPVYDWTSAYGRRSCCGSIIGETEKCPICGRTSNADVPNAQEQTPALHP